MANEVIPFEQKIGALPVSDVRAQVNLIQQVMKEVMQEGTHYGVIPGAGTKPVLLQPGAQKLCLTFRLDPQFESTEKYEGQHLTVKSKCVLYHIPTGQRIGSGEGSCTTKESKYAYRKASRKCPQCGKEAIIKGREEYGGGWVCHKKRGGCGAKYGDGDQSIESQEEGRVPNEDLADQYNTVLKMANKRALVAAVLNSTAASDIFTQDLEDMPVVQQEEVQKPAKKRGRPISEEKMRQILAEFSSKGIDEKTLRQHLGKDLSECSIDEFKKAWLDLVDETIAL